MIPLLLPDFQTPGKTYWERFDRLLGPEQWALLSQYGYSMEDVKEVGVKIRVGLPSLNWWLGLV